MADDLHQLILAAAEFGQLQFTFAAQSGQLKLAQDVALIVVRVHGLPLVQQELILLHQGVQILLHRHFGADLVDLLLKPEEILAKVGGDSEIHLLVPAGKLAGVADAAHVFPQELAVKDVLLRAADQVHQGGLAAAVAADEGTVAVLWQGERNFMI